MNEIFSKNTKPIAVKSKVFAKFRQATDLEIEEAGYKKLDVLCECGYQDCILVNIEKNEFSGIFLCHKCETLTFLSIKNDKILKTQTL